MVESLFRDSPTAFAKPVVDAFGAMVRAQTGVDATIVGAADAVHLGQKLNDNEVDFGIFQGIEYAWAHKKYPDLKPLMVVLNGEPIRHSLLVVRADSPIKGFADLQGRRGCMPRHSRLHCELFLERGCDGKEPCQVLSLFKQPDTVEDALDDVVDGRYDAAVVDAVAFKSYQRRKPGRSEKLRVAKCSNDFPPSIVAYKPGRIDDARLKQFREGLLSAHETILGRHLFMLWRMTAFQPVPDDLDQTIDSILKVYPAPTKQAGKEQTAGKK
jgi:ABC-type phosphate/phosphonate transport system substrate-binding protein